MARRPLVAALILTAALVLTGCNSGTLKISGTVTVPLPENETWSTPCTGMGGYTDLASGAQVTITDEAGTVIAVGSLNPGQVIATPPQGHACKFGFSVNAPKGHTFYGVEIAHRGRSQYPASRLKDPITLGVTS